MRFYGREAQIAELHRIQELAFTDYSKMTVITGRRRIGKTSLITKALTSSRYGSGEIPTLYLFVSRKSEGALCRQFAEEASASLGVFIPAGITSFGSLFRMLMEIAQTKMFNLVLDEFQEFSNINPSVFSDMQNYWDQYRKESKVNLLISGSVYTLMHKIFQGSKEPLFGRADNIIGLKPFSTGTIKQIMADHNPSYSNDDLLALFAFTGGVPKYIELFCDVRALTVSKMINFMARENSPFIDEGRNLLITEFGKNYGTYFALLGAVAEGATTQHGIEQLTGNRAIGGYINRLVDDYQVLSKKRPIFSKKTSQTVRYEIEDLFLRYWFAYFDRYRPLIELENFGRLAKVMKEGYPTYSGQILERYFKKQLAESGEFKDIGSWWETKGSQNEIDIVALKLEKNQALAVEVKRCQENFRITKLQEKVERLKKKDMPSYQFELKCLTLEDI
jgi:AAA+ ATPase superfamily predicted ATPase